MRRVRDAPSATNLARHCNVTRGGHYRKSVAPGSVGRLRFKLKRTDRNGYIPIRRLFYLKVHLFLRCRILHRRRQ